MTFKLITWYRDQCGSLYFVKWNVNQPWLEKNPRLHLQCFVQKKPLTRNSILIIICVCWTTSFRDISKGPLQLFTDSIRKPKELFSGVNPNALMDHDEYNWVKKHWHGRGDNLKTNVQPLLFKPLFKRNLSLLKRILGPSLPVSTVMSMAGITNSLPSLSEVSWSFCSEL